MSLGLDLRVVVSDIVGCCSIVGEVCKGLLPGLLEGLEEGGDLDVALAAVLVGPLPSVGGLSHALLYNIVLKKL